ncbi:MAG: 7-carboxy-7-deazaguanine synthase QueE [Thermoplasmata archaeon]|nr:MAG: 7-carboxy-7-deazaguanine synthase QueE [Thermoplasmata archaeon]
MKISEIFYSIQGEGTLAGYPTIFIRASGCNLRCSYCDTKYAYEEPGTEMNINEILGRIKQYKARYVCVTGGEPLLQKETIELIDKLLKIGYNVSLETNGSIDISNIADKFSSYEKSFLISLDIKCLSSGMHGKMMLSNIDKLRKHDQLKFVIDNREDYEYAKKLMGEYNPKCIILFQPVWGKDPKKVAEWLLSDALNARLSLQIHKIIWGDKRGI